MIAPAYALMKERGLRLWLIEASLVFARITRDDGGLAAADRITALLDEAEALIAATGARLFTPFVLVERAALAALRTDDAERLRLLREAQRLFTEVGAAGRAQALARELDL